MEKDNAKGGYPPLTESGLEFFAKTMFFAEKTLFFAQFSTEIFLAEKGDTLSAADVLDGQPLLLWSFRDVYELCGIFRPKVMSILKF